MNHEPTWRASLPARKFSIAALASAMMLVALAPGALAGAAPAPTSITFDYLQLGSQCVYATAAPSVSVELTWKDSFGALKFSETQLSNEFGDLYYCSPGASVVIAIGDRLRATVGSTTHRLVIPELTIDVNRALNKLKGTAPAGATLRVECGGGPLPAFEPCMWSKRISASANGKWSKLVPWDAIGGEMFFVRWKSAGGDIVYAMAITPFVTVTLGKSQFTGATGAGQAAHLTLSDATTHEVEASGSAVGDPNGRFSGRFRDAAGNRVPVSPGDELDGYVAPDADMIVPDIEATASAGTNTVSGRCFDTGRSDRTVFLQLFRSGHERGWVVESTDVDGNFAIDFMADGFRDPANVKVGDKILVQCMQTGGDWVQRNIVAGA
jgi:hypothetical protein